MKLLSGDNRKTLLLITAGGILLLLRPGILCHDSRESEVPELHSCAAPAVPYSSPYLPGDLFGLSTKLHGSAVYLLCKVRAAPDFYAEQELRCLAAAAREPTTTVGTTAPDTSVPISVHLYQVLLYRLFYFATTFFAFCQPTTLPVFFFLFLM